MVREGVAAADVPVGEFGLCLPVQKQQVVTLVDLRLIDCDDRIRPVERRSLVLARLDKPPNCCPNIRRRFGLRHFLSAVYPHIPMGRRERTLPPRNWILASFKGRLSLVV